MCTRAISGGALERARHRTCSEKWLHDALDPEEENAMLMHTLDTSGPSTSSQQFWPHRTKSDCWLNDTLDPEVEEALIRESCFRTSRLQAISPMRRRLDTQGQIPGLALAQEHPHLEIKAVPSEVGFEEEQGARHRATERRRRLKPHQYLSREGQGLCSSSSSSSPASSTTADSDSHDSSSASEAASSHMPVGAPCASVPPSSNDVEPWISWKRVEMAGPDLIWSLFLGGTCCSKVHTQAEK